MSDYQPFFISEFKSGLYNYTQPYLRAPDAFQPLVNAYVNRGVLQKRAGSTLFGNRLEDQKPVMGIMVYENQETGVNDLVVASTQYLYKFTAGLNPDQGTFAKVNAVAKSPFWTGTATGTISTNLWWTNLAAGTVSVTDGTTTILDDGSGVFPAEGIFASGTINYVSGAVTFTFVGTTKNVTLNVSTTLLGSSPIFTGTIANFFNWTNWQPTSSITAISTSYLYMTNNVDSVTLFDGISMSRPAFFVDSTSTVRINRALDVKVYGNRLLLIRPTLSSSPTNAANQDIYYSALFSPFNFVGDITGNGGAISAATGDRIMNAKFLRNVMIVGFSRGEWSFEQTGNTLLPFIFRRLSIAKNVGCPYASVEYDEKITDVGNTGLIACDGVNVQRYDMSIIDYFEDVMNQKYFNQVFATRYDNLNQTWMFYPSTTNTNPLIDGVAPGSDQTLVFNFLENTWATFNNPAPMTCMGLFYNDTDMTWASSEDTWETADYAWNYFVQSATVPILLGGDVNGYVYHLDNEAAVRDGMTPVLYTGGTSFQVEINSVQWNPFLQTGQKTQFGYIDIYYGVVSSDPLNPIQLTLLFYVDNSSTIAWSRVLTLDGPVGSETNFKRIYCNLTGQFIEMEIDPSEDAAFEIYGIVLWSRPAGRLTR
jgi:hypothetical protein